MASAPSSAEPDKLFGYSSRGLQIDSELMSEASHLAASLQHFEATCTEPGFQVPCVHLANDGMNLSGHNESADNWVQQVAVGFQIADSFGTLGQATVGGTGAQLRRGQILSTNGSTRNFSEETSLHENPGTRLPDAGDELEKLDHRYEMLHWAALTSLLILKTTDSLGRLHVFGSDWLKGLAGVNEKLTLVRPENFGRALAKESLFGKVGPGEILGLASNVWVRDVLDPELARKGEAHVASALVVDTALYVGFTRGGEAIGSVAGAGLLTAVGLAPFAPWGAAVGSVAGGIAGTYAYNWFHNTPLHSAMVDSVAEIPNMINAADRAVGQAVETGWAQVQQAAHSVDNVLGNTVNAVLNVPKLDFRLNF